MSRTSWLALTALVSAACGHTRPATHVELVDEGGASTYVSGAFGSGSNKSLACSMAVTRAVTALAERYAENDDLADDVAEALDVDDAKPFLFRYAREEALDAAVQDVEYDPIDHLCKAIVRWQPPVFAKEAVLGFAEKVKAAELAERQPAAAASAPAPAAPQPVAPVAPAAPPPAQYVAQPSSPLAPAPVAAPQPQVASTPPACSRERRGLDKALESGRKADADYSECLRRTGNDATICHRYGLYAEQATAKQAGAGRALSECLNAALATGIRRALASALPGHAGRPMETRADGSLVVWTVSPVDATAYALEVSPDGQAGARTPLAANQVQWLRQQLGL